MKYLNLERYLNPLNFFEIHGNFCCKRMHEAFGKSFITRSTFFAASLFEANVVVLWGSFSKKLIHTFNEPINIGCKKYLIHVQGCEARINNEIVFSSLDGLLPIDRIISYCEFSKIEHELVFKEARQCLKA